VAAFQVFRRGRIWVFANINGKRAVTPDTALRLARVLGMSADFWLGLQQDWDLWHALRSKDAAAIAHLRPLRHAS
jgi:plasmid maintenance system antidote protein VapI